MPRFHMPSVRIRNAHTPPYLLHGSWGSKSGSHTWETPFINWTIFQPRVLVLSRPSHLAHLYSQVTCNQGGSISHYFYKGPDGSWHRWPTPGKLTAKVCFHTQAWDRLDHKESDHRQSRCVHGSGNGGVKAGLEGCPNMVWSRRLLEVLGYALWADPF